MKRKNNYQSGNKNSSKKRSAFNQGDRQSRREACGQKKKKNRVPRQPNKEMKKIMKKHGLNTGSKFYETPLYNCTDYEKNYKMMWDFFQRIGCWKSMIILVDDLYDNGNPVPPMDPQDLYLFMKYKRGNIGENITVDTIVGGKKKTSVLKDLKGKIVKCVGGWLKLPSENQFMSAVLSCHQERGNVLPYAIACSSCEKSKCKIHPNNEKWFSHGNPITSDVLRNRMAFVEESTVGMITKKANALYPEDFFQLGKHLLMTNDPCMLMLWTIIVLGKNGYLREHEISCTKVEDLVTATWPKWNGYGKVPFLTYHLIRKRGSRQFMTMWSENVHFITDPIVMLFWWLSYSDIRNGFIFPKMKEVSKESFANHQPCTFGEITLLYNNVCSSLFSDSLKYKQDCWTLHGLRRTEFLFAVFGGAEDQQIQQDSCIVHGSTFTTYMNERRAEYDYIKSEEPYQLEFLSKYKGKEIPYLKYTCIPEEKRFDIKILNDYLNKFKDLYPCVSKKSNIHTTGLYFMNIVDLREKYIKQIPVLNEKVESYLQMSKTLGITNLPRDILKNAQETFTDYTRLIEVIINLSPNQNIDLPINLDQTNVQSNIVSNDTSSTAFEQFTLDSWTKSKNKFNNTFSDDSLSMTSRIESVIVLSEKYDCINNYIVNDFPLPSSKTIPKAPRMFIQQKLKYMYKCIKVCHNNDYDSFQETMKKESVTLQLKYWHNKCPCSNKF